MTIIKTVTASEPYGGDPWKVEVTTLNVKHGGLRVEIAVPGEDGPSWVVLNPRWRTDGHPIARDSTDSADI